MLKKAMSIFLVIVMMVGIGVNVYAQESNTEATYNVQIVENDIYIPKSHLQSLESADTNIIMSDYGSDMVVMDAEQFIRLISNYAHGNPLELFKRNSGKVLTSFYDSDTGDFSISANDSVGASKIRPRNTSYTRSANKTIGNILEATRATYVLKATFLKTSSPVVYTLLDYTTTVIPLEGNRDPGLSVDEIIQNGGPTSNQSAVNVTWKFKTNYGGNLQTLSVYA